MGSHRADRRGRNPRPSGPSRTAPAYAGRRVAGREPATLSTAPLTDVTPVLGDVDATAELPRAVAPSGKRRAVKHAGSRGPLFKAMPSAPVLVGVAVLAVSVGGTVSSVEPDLTGGGHEQLHPATAMSGSSAVGTVSPISRRGAVSRDSDREALDDLADTELVKAAEEQAQERNAALARFAKEAEKQAQAIALNQWVYPLDSLELTATFGEYGLWSSYHTGLDFNGNSGEEIHAIAGGVVTSVGYDGAYGNKTVITLADGTEIWYCHQTDFLVSEGDVVRAGEVIGTVGATGNVTGSHLHVEVRPGGGDPVDPYAAMQVHGLF